MSLKNLFKYLKPFDFLFIILSLSVLVTSIFYARNTGYEQPRLIVETQEGQWIYSLEIDSVYEFSGPMGITQVEVKDGKVKIVSSPCKNKTCEIATPISEFGQWIACMPNRVSLRIGTPSENENKLDSVSF